MSKKIAFDTLDYARMLQKGGVEYAEVHAASLAESIVQNIYTKDEVDKMIEAALRRSDERFERSYQQTNEAIRRFEQGMQEMRIEIKEMDNRLEKVYMRSVMTTISVLGTLIVIVGAVSTFAHYLFR